MGNQFSAFILVALGTLLTVGFTNQRPSLILLFPILMLFATFVSLSNIESIRNLGYYIRTNIEPHFIDDNLDWEKFRLNPSLRSNTFYHLSNISFFVGISVLVIATGYYFLPTFNSFEIILLVVATICWLVTILLPIMFNNVSRRQDAQKKPQKEPQKELIYDKEQDMGRATLLCEHLKQAQLYRLL